MPQNNKKMGFDDYGFARDGTLFHEKKTTRDYGYLYVEVYAYIKPKLSGVIGWLNYCSFCASH